MIELSGQFVTSIGGTDFLRLNRTEICDQGTYATTGAYDSVGVSLTVVIRQHIGSPGYDDQWVPIVVGDN